MPSEFEREVKSSEERLRGQKIMFFDFPNHQKSSFGDVLGASLRSLGVSWAALARLRRIWGVLWVRLGASEGVLEAS